MISDFDANIARGATVMEKLPRRQFLRDSAGIIGAAACAALLPASIRRALAVGPAVNSGTLQDVQHVVILMLENRSFDHYFGTMRGVRGFGDPFPIPLATGKPVWFESDGGREIPPYHLNSATSSALLVPGSPHTFSDAQAAWNQGAFGKWPLYKTQYSMGYYRREDIPFQFALAEAFTICDNYHCSVTAGTDPNRIVFFSGSNFDPQLRAQGVNCTVGNAEVNNYRCLTLGTMPSPGYSYRGSAFTWPTLPELLQNAGISWRIYQNPNDNGGSLFHGGLAFQNFRNATAASGGPLYNNGMTLRTIKDLQADVAGGQLAQVSWILPGYTQSEHPDQSTPDAGANFISQLLDAITANPAVWSQTVFFITYDENDGFFDHLPPPAVPSYNNDGTLAGGSTLPLAGEYLSDPAGDLLNPSDTISGKTRPWGLGARVPLFVISPWSRGGWVNSQVFDHTSVALFLERRFGLKVDSISPWHRAISGDLTSAFDFTAANPAALPALPDMSNYAAVDAAQARLPTPTAPGTAQPLFQEPGIRPSRALPYILNASAMVVGGSVSVTFTNSGGQGVVFHVYDQLHLDRIPRRYTVEAGKDLADVWSSTADAGAYDLWVYGPNGFLRVFRGNTGTGASMVEVRISYSPGSGEIMLQVQNNGAATEEVTIAPNNRFLGGTQTLTLSPGGSSPLKLNLATSGYWYDFTASAGNSEQRFAGRMETGQDGFSDPAMARS
jgi:phospholipase C